MQLPMHPIIFILDRNKAGFCVIAIRTIMDPIAQVAVHIRLAQLNQNLVAESVVDLGVYSSLLSNPLFAGAQAQVTPTPIILRV